MNIRKTEDFQKSLKKLPLEIQKLYKKQETLFENNWGDPRLHTKIIKELPGVHSFRITRRYRVLFYFRGNAAIFFAVGHRKNVYE